MYRLVKRSDFDSKLWNKAADSFQDAWLWHRWESIDAYSTWERTKDLSFALVENQSDKVIGLLPLIRHTRGWLIPFPQVRLESTGGPAYANDLTQLQQRQAAASMASNIRSLAKKEGAYQVDLSSAPLSKSNLNNWSTKLNPLIQLGCSDTSTQSWALELRNKTKEQLWQGMEHRARKSIKRALRAGVDTRQLVLDDEEDFLRLIAANSRRTGISAKPQTYYQRIFSNFLASGLARGFCGFTNSNDLHSIHIFGIYKKASIYWVVASSDYSLSVGANNLVQWAAICQLAEEGIFWYESGEAFPTKTEGKLKRISDFKKSFGGALVPYHRGTLKCRPTVVKAYEYMRILREQSRLFSK